MQINTILKNLNALADPAVVIAKQKKFGIVAENALGIYHKELKEIAKELPKDAILAAELFDTGIYEARLLCSKIFPPKQLTKTLMEKWVVTFDNWEICDSFCMAVFAKGPSELSHQKIIEWSERDAEFEKRAAFATLAALTMADKKSGNEVFEPYFDFIQESSTDERVYVKKAVNWALRQMGKRNIDLKDIALKKSKLLADSESRAAQWIGKNALTELTKSNVRIADYPRSIYRK